MTLSETQTQFPNYENLNITNRFMFGKIMRNPKLCIPLLETILHIKIKELVYIDSEKSIEPSVTQKGIRVDIYVDDGENTIYNLEMQVKNEYDLPFRSRYYQGIIDLNLLEKGMDYDRIKLSYVIFICMFDPFGKGHYIYTFTNRCKEVKDLELGDGRTIIFLNANGNQGEISRDLKDLLDYFKNLIPKNELASNIDNEVKMARANAEWRREYMWLELELNNRYRKGAQFGAQKTRTKDLEIIKALKSGNSIEHIAQLLDVTTEEVKEIDDAMNQHHA